MPVIVIQDSFIDNVYIGIHNDNDNVSISGGSISNTTRHGILSSGDNFTVSEMQISTLSGNGITISGGKNVQLTNLTIQGSGTGTGIQIGRPAPSINDADSKLDDIISLFLKDLDKIRGAEAAFARNVINQIGSKKSKSIPFSAYDRIWTFVASNATILTALHQFFPALFGR